jgi:hypothetical protein
LKKQRALPAPQTSPAIHKSVTLTHYGRRPKDFQAENMGYRELLKSYIRHLELVAGENFIEREASEPVLNKRDLGELRTLAAEIQRDAYRGADIGRVENYNYRLRVLMNRHALTAGQVAELAEVGEPIVGRWRTNPGSERYSPMSEAEFARFESALNHWLETSGL